MKVVSSKVTGWNDVKAVAEFTKPVIHRARLGGVAAVIYQVITILHSVEPSNCRSAPCTSLATCSFRTKVESK